MRQPDPKADILGERQMHPNSAKELGGEGTGEPSTQVLSSPPNHPIIDTDISPLAWPRLAGVPWGPLICLATNPCLSGLEGRVLSQVQ